MAVTDMPTGRLIPLLDAYGLAGTWLGLLRSLAADTYAHEAGYRMLQDPEFNAAPVDVPNLLAGLSIGEIGVLYEFSLAHMDHTERKNGGRFFTPDDVARFLAQRTDMFERDRVWLDPCCGVGNLTYWLIARQTDPERFLLERLYCIDIDPTALLIARGLFTLLFYRHEADLFAQLAAKFVCGDFLSMPLPAYDYALLNPPYVGVVADDRFATAACRDLYAYFLERVSATGHGFVAITPQGFTNNTGFASLRQLLLQRYRGLTIYCFDNMPDTIFRGIKFGSRNTNQKNSTRAAVTVAQETGEHRITPLLRWVTERRQLMLDRADAFLAATPFEMGGYPKIDRELIPLWESALNWDQLGSWLSATPTTHRLVVPATPRYYISATLRDLTRANMHVLYFHTAAQRDLAYLLLNSSFTYWWWRVNDGGMTIATATLQTLPIPPQLTDDMGLLDQLRASEAVNLVIKMNAGKPNENVKHPPELLAAVNDHIFGADMSTILLTTHRNSYV